MTQPQSFGTEGEVFASIFSDFQWSLVEVGVVQFFYGTLGGFKGSIMDRGSCGSLVFVEVDLVHRSRLFKDST